MKHQSNSFNGTTNRNNDNQTTTQRKAPEQH